ncbi:glyceraldehyde-3-phosphate dehydrogenase GAPCP1, chloroplastic-like [Vitis riparia]|uniref:glyceraldehyde-3-phosphate dehydrogenase GAPCP1, chloroplastic-like n=1 Tax=Vitis riparia TaxID=96939 RepID=UPI00155A07A1|nr:glyceraldehyde-3-phosphate dehydrogenase GAPCP1, chloroplastic-like [Vitis riparia]
MALYSLFRSAPSAAAAAATVVDSSRPSDRCKVSCIGFNSNADSLKVQTTIFGTPCIGNSSSLQKCCVRSLQPIKATATELPPTVQK